MQNVTDISSLQLETLTGEQTCVALVHTVDLQPVGERSAHNGTDRRVHTGCVTTGGEDPDSLHRHWKLPLVGVDSCRSFR
ncbi:hypothetical protein BMS3Bbin02_01450 [bacterium BMS3Bbin02]|nr:hypothetical protein BMS3Bbin02_01450 [bacterium BMS3Bbin02]